MLKQPARIVCFNLMKRLLVVSLIIAIQGSAVFSDFLNPVPNERRASGHSLTATAGDVGGKSTIKDKVFKDSTETFSSGRGNNPTAAAALNLAKLVNDAITSSTKSASAPANQTILGSITSSTRFASIGRPKIIDVTGNVNWRRSRNFDLPLDRPGTDGLSSVSASHSFGTIPVPEKPAIFDGSTVAKTVLPAALIDGGNTTGSQSTAYVTGDAIPPPGSDAAVPEPASLIVWSLLIGIGFVALRQRHCGVRP
jgi:hypothetical protein